MSVERPTEFMASVEYLRRVHEKSSVPLHRDLVRLVDWCEHVEAELKQARTELDAVPREMKAKDVPADYEWWQSVEPAGWKRWDATETDSDYPYLVRPKQTPDVAKQLRSFFAKIPKGAAWADALLAEFDVTPKEVTNYQLKVTLNEETDF